MPNYRINGEIVPADSPEQAYSKYTAGQTAPEPESAMQQFEQRTAERPFMEQALLGVGRGMSNVGRQVGNILAPILPDSLAVSDAELESYRQLDQPLMNTTGGKVGSVIGEIAATAPVAGGIVGAGAKGLGAAMPSVKAAMSGTRMGQLGTGAGLGLSEGAIEGALLAGPDNRAQGAALGGTLGAGGGALLPLLTRGFRAPSDEAKTLMGMEPSPDLTPGMMKPGGMINQLEQAAGSIKGVGPLIRGARETPQRQFAEAMVNEGRPPGTPAIAGTDVNSMLEEAYMGFVPAYNQLKGYALDPAIQRTLADDFSAAADSQVVAATDDTRKAVARYLDNQTTLLKNKADSDELLEIRSNIREQGRKAKKAQNDEKSELFDEAEKAVTARINEVLPAEAIELNKAIDRQYAKHKIAESAIYKMGGRDFPTPTQWEKAVQNVTKPSEYAHGGGLMRPLTKAAADAFKTTDPATGARLLTMGAGAGVGGGLATGAIDPNDALAWGIPLALLSATKGGRRFAVGESGLQKMMQEASSPQPFMSTGVPDLPGMYLRSIAPIAGQED